MDYANQYGSATLKPTGQIMNVSDVIGSDILAKGLGFSIETAAHLALITGNKSLQFGFDAKLQKSYVVYHHSSNQVQACELVALNTVQKNPHDALSQLNRAGMHYG